MSNDSLSAHMILDDALSQIEKLYEVLKPLNISPEVRYIILGLKEIQTQLENLPSEDYYWTDYV